MKKNQIDELIQKLNEFRMANQNKSFTAAELNKALQGLGFSIIDASTIAQKCFTFEQMGKCRLYEVPKDPIHKSILVSIYSKSKEYWNQKYHESHSKKKSASTTISNISDDKFTKAMDEQKAIKLLLSLGYKIYKPKGFNMSKFKEDHADIYSKYIVYDAV